jgi:hypothetical protein
MLAFNTGPLEIVDLVVEGVETNNRNVTDPENSYVDEAFRGYERHRDRRILERARILGGPPAFTGAQADRFLRDICSWTREDAPTVMQTDLEMGYRDRLPALAG